jgi:hypothetical protein
MSLPTTYTLPKTRTSLPYSIRYLRDSVNEALSNKLCEEDSIMATEYSDIKFEIKDKIGIITVRTSAIPLSP